MTQIIVRNETALREAQRQLVARPLIAFDTETTGLRWYKSKIFMSSFSDGEITWVIPFRHFHLGTLSFFHRLILQSPGEVVGHNIKFELNHLKGTFNGVGPPWNVKRKIHDTMVMAHLLDENQRKGLKPLAHKHLGIPPDERIAVTDWLQEHHGLKENWHFEQVPEEIMLPYSGKDALITAKLFTYFKIGIDKHFAPLYATEMEIVDILHRMEQNGLPIDMPYAQAKKEETALRVEVARKAVYAGIGFEFNVESDLELAEVLYDKLGLPVPAMTEKGQRSTDEDALDQLDHPLAGLVIAYRKERHRHDVFRGYVDLADEKGLVHPDYRTTGAKSGRFSCGDPNAQNVPKDPEIQRMYVVEPGFEAWTWDQSQIEMIGLAHYSGDPGMRAALRAGRDLHATTTAGIFGIPYEEALKDKVRRAVGKGSNFAMSFLVGKAKLAKFINKYLPEGSEISHEQAMAYKEAFQKAFPQLKRWAYKVIETVKINRQEFGHHVRNTFGRVGRIDPEKAYQGVNRIIQSWAADLFKASMVRIDKALGKPLFRQQIHDAIRIDLPQDTKGNMRKAHEVVRCLTNWPGVSVPISCAIEKFSKNWAESEKII